MKNQLFKFLSVFLLGLILGYLLKGCSFGPQAVSSISEAGSVKVMGQENAPVTMVEYSDFQCPLCKKFYNETYKKILADYVQTGKVKYVFKHFPLSIHPQAPAAALATECALEQNKFWEMHDLLFENQTAWSGKSDHLDTFKQYAKQLALDENQFNQCLDSQKHQNNVEKDFQESLSKGVRGTPTFYINDEILVGALDSSEFTKMLDRALNPPSAEATTQPAPAN